MGSRVSFLKRMIQPSMYELCFELSLSAESILDTHSQCSNTWRS